MPKERNKADSYREKAPIKREKRVMHSSTLPSVRCLDHLYDEDKIFHLRGAIAYSIMGLKHKLMMKFMHSKLARMPKEELNAESKIILETYGKKVDYVDFNTLQPIVNSLFISLS
jgi:hypothetical protein